MDVFNKINWQVMAHGWALLILSLLFDFRTNRIQSIIKELSLRNRIFAATTLLLTVSGWVPILLA